jgi:large subunit ribosomal protein L11
MAKKVKTVIKLNLQAGKANPAPPVGTALGPHGVNIMDFCTKYNAATKDKMGQMLPAQITIYDDRTFEFVIKLPPVSEMIKQTLKIKSGAANVKKDVAGTLTPEQLEAIAKEKMGDMNTVSLEAAKATVAGTARSMGIKIGN